MTLDRLHQSSAKRPGLILLVAVACALGPASPARALGTFTRHVTIAVGAGVVGGPLANFPVLVDVTNADLRTTPTGSVQSANGYDIVFRGEDATTCGGPATCMLDHEIELYDGAAGRVVAWVRVPSLVASTSAIHIYYGNNQIASATEAPAAVFDANYVGVWHLRENGNGTLNEYRDSSRYGNHGQGGQGAANATPTLVAGKIGNGQHWDKATDNVADFIDVGQDSSLNITGNQITMEGWVKHDVTLSYSTGTASVALGGTVVTIAGGSLPGWVGPGDWIDFTGAPAESIMIGSRNSATQVTVNWAAGSAHTNQTYTVRAAQPYGVVNHKGYNDGYRLYLEADPTTCPDPSGTLTDPCLGMGVPGHSDQLYSSQYGSPATDPVTLGVWHHVVGTYDNAEMKLYVDGQKVLAAATGANHLLDDGTCFAAGVHCGSIGVGGTTVTFDTALPGSVGAGDVLIFDTRQGGTVENFLVLSKPTATTVTVSPAAAFNHVAATGSYKITSPFKTGNLTPSLAEQHVWIGHADQPQNVGWSSPWVGDLDEVRISRVARSAGWIQTEYNNQNNPATFYAVSGPVGVAQALPTLTTVYRSIGTNAATLYSTGTATVALGGTVITFAGGASLPTNLGQGDQLDLTGPVETLFILSRDSATQVTVQTPATSAHAGAYTIKRAYNTLQAWETALPANLVAANVREVGVAYNDGVFNAGLTFSGQVTDPVHNIVLTTAIANRQTGIANNPYGTTNGVVLNNGANNSAAIVVWDEDVTIERFEITGGGPFGAPGIDIEQTGAKQVVVRNCLIRDIPAEDGIWVSDANATVEIYDNFVYNTEAAVRIVKDISPSGQLKIFNNTFYNNRTAGVTSRDYIGSGGTALRQTSMRVSLRNNIVHTNPVDLDVARAFNEGYWCTAISGQDPTGCANITNELGDATANYQLQFSSGTTCLYVGSTTPFRGVSAGLAVGGGGNGSLRWDYWNGAAWTDLSTVSPPFWGDDMYWNGFAYWPDDAAGWVTRSVNAGAALYYVRACLASGSYSTFPTERVIARTDVSVESRYNLTGDKTASYHNLWHGAGVTGAASVPLSGAGGINFNSATDLHIQATSVARDAILDGSRQDGGWESAALSTRFRFDVDYQSRPLGPDGACTASGATCWDIGADEYAPTTAVRLMSFAAVGSDGAVDLSWQTGSELNNLGFNLYRSLSSDGPWSRITPSLIPGLGSSPAGASYSWHDSGLTNGQRYFYRLEDVDTSSVSTFHDPVSAVPTAADVSQGSGGVSGSSGTTGSGSGSGSSSSGSGSSASTCPAWVLAAFGSSFAPDATGNGASSFTCQSYGEPSSTSLRVVSRSSSGAVVELSTSGFVALRESTGSVRVFIPGFELPSDPSAPALPVRRALVDAVVGRGVRLDSVEAFSLNAYPGLRPAATGSVQMDVSSDGTVRPARRHAALRSTARGRLSRELAWLAGTVFQGEDKHVVVEISPLRYDAARSRLVLAQRVRVKLSFTNREAGETGSGSVGRHASGTRRPTQEVLAQLQTSRPGLYAVAFSDLFPGRRRGVPTSQLRLQRQGLAVPFHVEPAGPPFGPGSVLFFYADTSASSTDFSAETAFELVSSSDGQAMEVVAAAPSGARPATLSTGFASFETNRFYQPGLLDAPDPWLWEAAWGGISRTKSFSLSGVDPLASQPARLVVFLQGGSDAEGVVDHHLRFVLNGASVGETSFDGEAPARFETSVPASLLREGSNDLTLENVGDTGVYSLVFLDKFSLDFPQTPSARGGLFEGTWSDTGSAEISGIVASPVVLDVSSPVRWLSGLEGTATSVRFLAQAAHRYLVASREALLAPRIVIPTPSSLRSTQNQADFIVIAPQAFLPAAQPLLDRRVSQGLSSLGVSFEEITSAFGYGQPSAQAIHDFLSFAYHSWRRPSPRYVLLLGESTYDPRNFTAAAHASPLPALWTRTSYLWTVSDPLLAAVNGDDSIPDLAIGRLPATDVAEAQGMIAKVLDWEDSGQSLDGRAVFVADNPDQGGDFEADVADIARGLLAGRETEQILLSQLGAETRSRILDSFDAGASLMSYVGHGGAAVWASENVLNSWDPPSLREQSRQPFMMTMNCLNGYFVSPSFDAISEAFLKAQGRGTIASFSPSGLSLDGPAHLYHRALIAEIVSGHHARLGDALLAAQRDYALSGAFPELLSIYHLLGDPTLKIGR